MALASNSMYSFASSIPISDGQVLHHFSEATACTHDIILQLKPAMLLMQSAAAAYLTCAFCNMPTVLGRSLVSSVVTGEGSFLPLVQSKLKCAAQAAF